MMRLLLPVFLLILCAELPAQNRNVLLTWDDTRNPANTTYHVYRASGDCASPGAFARITPTPITAKTHTDTGRPIGTTWCYQVTAVVASMESGPSNRAGGNITPYEPTDHTFELVADLQALLRGTVTIRAATPRPEP
mgnify:CR=1 FL=1